MIKSVLKPALAAGIALAAFATPAAAQVNGVATFRPALVIALSAARQAAYQAIATQYAAQITQLEQIGTQRSTLLRSLDTNGNGQFEELDTNGDGNLDETEQSANPTLVQVGTLDQQLSQLQTPIQLAQIYAISQIAEQSGTATQEVITARGVQVLLSPDAIVYGVEGVDISEQVVTSLNTRTPTVTTAVPAGWQPDEGTVSLYQQVQQMLQALAARQQAGAAAPAAGAVPPR
ncbi:MAG: OmpH family outer membrane protein [Alteraurantiacibacter sp.]